MQSPTGHYRPAVAKAGWIHIAGQTAEEAEEGRTDLATQVVTSIESIAAILRHHGAGLADVVRMTCYITDLDQMAVFESVYVAAMQAHQPVRTTVCVSGLPGGALVEIDAITSSPSAGDGCDS